MDSQNDITVLMADLKEEATISSVKQAIIAGIDPLDIIEWCHQGMVQVGERYERGDYAIAGLIMAGEIMRQVGLLVFPLIKNRIINGDSGRIVLGTVQGDIHYIGKDIFKVLVRGHGFTVHDLGVDVSASDFLAAILDVKPDIVGLSCLISATFEAMRETLSFLNKNIPPESAPRAYIIGGRIDKHIASYMGVRYWTNNAMKGVQLCEKIMKQK